MNAELGRESAKKGFSRAALRIEIRPELWDFKPGRNGLKKNGKYLLLRETRCRSYLPQRAVKGELQRPRFRLVMSGPVNSAQPSKSTGNENQECVLTCYLCMTFTSIRFLTRGPAQLSW
jgi:hypothetical protein